MNKAHLVIWIDTRRDPQTIVSAGVYSEETPSTMMGLRPCSIYFVSFDNSSPTENFGVVAREIRTLVETNLAFAWLRPLMGKSIQVER